MGSGVLTRRPFQARSASPYLIPHQWLLLPSTPRVSVSNRNLRAYWEYIGMRVVRPISRQERKRDDRGIVHRRGGRCHPWDLLEAEARKKQIRGKERERNETHIRF